MNPSSYLRNFRNCTVLVAGDAILDAYRNGVTEKLCREAPAPVVTLQEDVFSCGGAANTAVNIAALGATVRFMSLVGTDQHGDELVRKLESSGVDASHLLRTPKRRTVTKTRICASSSILVRVDEGDTTPIDNEFAERFMNALRRQLHGIDALVLSDYGYGFFSEQTIRALIDLRANIKVPVVVDARDPGRFSGLSPTVVKPNYEEATMLLGIPRVKNAARTGQLLSRGNELLQKTNAKVVAATLDVDGTLLFERGSPPCMISCVPQPEKRSIGAGDSFVGALSLALAVGARPQAAARIAAASAAVVIKKDGTGVCSNDDLRAYFHGDEKRVTSVSDLNKRLDDARRHKRRIVFTNGCFDILHRGHVEFLKQARSLGDVLVVALNSDAGIRRLKGSGRPVNTLEDRIEVLAGLQVVDFLIAFDEESPTEILRTIRPDVFAKGGTYSVDSLPEAELVRDLGGQVEIVPLHGALSTSLLIDKIQRSGDNPSVLRSGQRAL